LSITQSDKRILIVERSSRWKWPQNLCLSAR